MQNLLAPVVFLGPVVGVVLCAARGCLRDELESLQIQVQALREREQRMCVMRLRWTVVYSNY